MMNSTDFDHGFNYSSERRINQTQRRDRPSFEIPLPLDRHLKQIKKDREKNLHSMLNGIVNTPMLEYEAEYNSVIDSECKRPSAVTVKDENIGNSIQNPVSGDSPEVLVTNCFGKKLETPSMEKGVEKLSKDQPSVRKKKPQNFQPYVPKKGYYERKCISKPPPTTKKEAELTNDFSSSRDRRKVNYDERSEKFTITSIKNITVTVNNSQEVFNNDSPAVTQELIGCSRRYETNDLCDESVNCEKTLHTDSPAPTVEPLNLKKDSPAITVQHNRFSRWHQATDSRDKSVIYEKTLCEDYPAPTVEPLNLNNDSPLQRIRFSRQHQTNDFWDESAKWEKTFCIDSPAPTVEPLNLNNDSPAETVQHNRFSRWHQTNDSRDKSVNCKKTLCIDSPAPTVETLNLSNDSPVQHNGFSRRHQTNDLWDKPANCERTPHLDSPAPTVEALNLSSSCDKASDFYNGLVCDKKTFDLNNNSPLPSAEPFNLSSSWNQANEFKSRCDGENESNNGAPGAIAASFSLNTSPSCWNQLNSSPTFNLTTSLPENFVSTCLIPPPHPASPKSNDVPLLPLQNGSHRNNSSPPTELGCPARKISTAGSGDSELVSDSQLYEGITAFLKEEQFQRSMPIQIANRIVSDLTRALKKRREMGIRVRLYGSFLSGVAITTSNVNLALVCEVPVKNNYLLSLQKFLSTELQNYHVDPFEEDSNPRRSKIFLSENEEGTNCELIYAGSTVQKHIEMSYLIKKISEYDERIKTLIIAVKIWCETCSIHETENGMLHPVGFVLLVIHFLQQLERPLLPVINKPVEKMSLNKLSVKNDSSEGELWLEFLKYYSYTFNWNEDVISVTSKKPLSKSSKPWVVSWIAIEDPISEKNVADSVASSDNAEFIFSSFKSAYEYFMSPDDSDSSSTESSVNGSRNSSPHCKKYSFNECVSHLPFTFFSDSGGDSDECEFTPVPQPLVLENFSKISDSSLKCVDRVLREVYEEFKVPEKKIEGRKAFVKDLEGYLRKIYPDAKLTLFGSSVNAFGFKNSDLDICMTLNAKTMMHIRAQQVLRSLVKHMRKNPRYEYVIALYGAQIPIVKFRYIAQNWSCDLSLYNILAVHNSNLLCKYALMDERCRILGCALKLLAKKACIADCPSKTLSSYSYILMVIHYLQQVEPPVLPVMPVHDKEMFEKELEVPNDMLNGRNFWYYESVPQLKKRYMPAQRNDSSVGELWLGLLEFYLKFDYKHTVNITEKEPVLSSSLQRCARLLNIEDPFLSKRNLGCIISESKAEETRRVLQRARILFGRDCPPEKQDKLKTYYFSPSNLTGRIIKDVECFSCGGFGHTKSDCSKANPFKTFKPRPVGQIPIKPRPVGQIPNYRNKRNPQ